ncbi:MAG: DUF3168 domain-containing protein [Anaerolineae bacterium]
MSAESDLYALLDAHVGLAAQVGERIYPDALPEDCTYPALVFARVGSETIVGISGQRFGEFVDFRIETWARTRLAADAAAIQVDTCLTAAGDPPSGRSAGFDPETGLYAAIIEVRRLAT